MKPETMMIDDVKYVREDSIKKVEREAAKQFEGLDYVMCRTYSAGVFAGYLKYRDGKEVTLFKARRIWSWAGAASLSQLAMEGTKKPTECKFPCEVDKVLLTGAIEIIPMTEAARISIASVPIWAA